MTAAALSEALRKYWGYDSFLPLQAEAMQAVLEGHDSVVVLPTGGGKSLCYQAPATCLEGLSVVVSPLISLMKDQVDALKLCGVPAACIHSAMPYGQRRQVADDVRAGRLSLLYVAPERLVMDRTIEFLKTAGVSMIAVDEAHCISEWGHDFRPEYRELKILKEAFADVGVHAYTATATEQVRSDIARQLNLHDPEFLVGSFDRPNLIYKVERRSDRLQQVRRTVERHEKEPGIVYCISRADVDGLAESLSRLGYRALPYHAGLSDEERRRNQEAFIQDRAEIIVATVAFGMGIDKSNVRFVVHAAMPKSLENYQQESGRAGRDGLEAECCLFFSGSDYHRWKRMCEDAEPQVKQAALRSLGAIYDYCTGVGCRHRTLVRHFGQTLDGPSCQACDVCLGELDVVDDALVIGQKILSCVVRLNQTYGGEYTSMVLSGSRDQRILASGHDRLSTWGILSEENRRDIRDWIEQLVEQEFLQRVGDYNILQLTSEGRRLLRGEVTPRLLKPRPKKRRREPPAATGIAADSWEGVDRELFEELRSLRTRKASEKGLPPYMVFNDAALRDMARRRPSTLDAFLLVRGVGEQKCQEYGEVFVRHITTHCQNNQLPMDCSPGLS